MDVSAEDKAHPLLGPIARHPNLSGETRRAYLYAVRRFLRHAGDDPRRWTHAAAEDWRDLDLFAAELSRPSVQLYLKALKFSSRARARRERCEDFAADVVLPRVTEEKNRRAIPEAAGAAMIATCDGTPVGARDRAILVLGFRTGMRRRGMAGIRFEDFGRGRNGEPVVWIVLKGGRRWDVPLDERCLAALAAWRAALEGLGVRDGAFWRGFERDGRTLAAKPFGVEGIYEVVARRARAAGVGHVSPHVLRHSAISWMVARKVPTYRIKRITGQLTDSIIDHYTTDLDGTPGSSVLPDEIG